MWLVITAVVVRVGCLFFLFTTLSFFFLFGCFLIALAGSLLLSIAYSKTFDSPPATHRTSVYSYRLCRSEIFLCWGSDGLFRSLLGVGIGNV